MAEYGSTGLWEFVHDENGPWRHSMTTFQRLGLGEDLISQFKAWIQKYEDENLSGSLDCEQFNATGLSLAFLVYEHLNRETYVEFQGEAPDGNLNEPVDISSL